MRNLPLPSEYDGPDHVLTHQDYDLAGASQTACNASGLVYSLAKVMDRLCVETQCRGKGTDWRNAHPLIFLYVVQLAHLSGVSCICDDLDRYSWCCRYCEERANQKEAQPCSDPAPCERSVVAPPAAKVALAAKAEKSAACSC